MVGSIIFSILDPGYKRPPYSYTCKKCGAINHRLKQAQEPVLEARAVAKALIIGSILGWFGWLADIHEYRQLVKARKCASCGWKFPKWE